jgi:hypothetical protein
MMNRNQEDALLWRRILDGLAAEVAGLNPEERAWLAPRLERIGCLQEELHALFLRAEGPRLCRDCRGSCCDRGRHHTTLVNLLGCLLAGRRPPKPDFGRPCPFLGPAGCLLEPARRPFNCVTFICEGIEERLGPAGRETFYARERELRGVYEEFDRRYAGSSLRGVLIRAERLGGYPLLAPPR